jgi:hypothetical protein
MFTFLEKPEYKNNALVIAYKRGYRFKNGKMFKNDVEIGLFYQHNYLSFNISLPRIDPEKRNRSKIILFKYFAFQEYGEDILLTFRVKAKDNNYENFTRENILVLKFEYLNNQIIKNKIVAASRSGFYVTAKGRLKYRGYDHEICVFKDKDNYKYFKFQNAVIKNKSIYIHKLQAYQKFGYDLFNSKLVRHLDDDSLNNKIENIFIGNYSQNYKDRRKFTIVSTSIKASKYPIEQRVYIRHLLSLGHSSPEIGLILNIPPNASSFINRYRTNYEKYLEDKGLI